MNRFEYQMSRIAVNEEYKSKYTWTCVVCGKDTTMLHKDLTTGELVCIHKDCATEQIAGKVHNLNRKIKNLRQDQLKEILNNGYADPLFKEKITSRTINLYAYYTKE